jgi:transcriptional regulator with XRE-family HTH domain
MGAPGKNQDQVNFIASKVDHLFRTITRPGGKPYTYQQVADGSGLDFSYIRKLRVGKVANPSRTALEKLSVFFGVKPDYWFRTDNAIPLKVQHQVEVDTSISSGAKLRGATAELLKRIEAADLSTDDIKRLNCVLDELLEQNSHSSRSSSI